MLRERNTGTSEEGLWPPVAAVPPQEDMRSQPLPSALQFLEHSYAFIALSNAGESAVLACK